jgi:hypothetical protein
MTTMCGQNEEFPNVKAGGTYNYHFFKSFANPKKLGRKH